MPKSETTRAVLQRLKVRRLIVTIEAQFDADNNLADSLQTVDEALEKLRECGMADIVKTEAEQ